MTFLISGVKKSRSTQFGVVLTTLLVTSTFLFGGESVQADRNHDTIHWRLPLAD